MLCMGIIAMFYHINLGAQDEKLCLLFMVPRLLIFFCLFVCLSDHVVKCCLVMRGKCLCGGFHLLPGSALVHVYITRPC